MPSIERLVPLLVYEDIAAAHDFLVQAFGFEPGGIERDQNGMAVHAEVLAETTRVWLHRVDPKNDLVSARSSSTATSGLYVQVDDVDAHFMRAQAKGAKVEGPPQDRSYGVREYASRDIEGHRWWFGSPSRS
jgi:MerR family transcriptional regulator, thiopeptide resistance regulator